MAILAGLFVLGCLFFSAGYIWWRIIQKTGYPGALGLLFLIPLVNMVFIIVLAFKEWPIQKQLKEAGISPVTKPLSRLAIILLVLGCSIPIMLLVAIAIPNLLELNDFGKMVINLSLIMRDRIPAFAGMTIGYGRQ